MWQVSKHPEFLFSTTFVIVKLDNLEIHKGYYNGKSKQWYVIINGSSTPVVNECVTGWMFIPDEVATPEPPAAAPAFSIEQAATMIACTLYSKDLNPDEIPCIPFAAARRANMIFKHLKDLK